MFSATFMVQEADRDVTNVIHSDFASHGLRINVFGFTGEFGKMVRTSIDRILKNNVF